MNSPFWILKCDLTLVRLVSERTTKLRDTGQLLKHWLYIPKINGSSAFALSEVQFVNELLNLIKIVTKISRTLNIFLNRLVVTIMYVFLWENIDDVEGNERILSTSIIQFKFIFFSKFLYTSNTIIGLSKSIGFFLADRVDCLSGINLKIITDLKSNSIVEKLQEWKVQNGSGTHVIVLRLRLGCSLAGG